MASGFLSFIHLKPYFITGNNELFMNRIPRSLPDIFKFISEFMTDIVQLFAIIEARLHTLLLPAMNFRRRGGHTPQYHFLIIVLYLFPPVIFQSFPIFGV
jgi:hypothetical protein